MSDATDSPLSGANAAMYTSPAPWDRCRLGDDHPAVGVADEHHRPVLRGDGALGHGDIVGQRVVGFWTTLTS